MQEATESQSVSIENFNKNFIFKIIFYKKTQPLEVVELLKYIWILREEHFSIQD